MGVIDIQIPTEVQAVALNEGLIHAYKAWNQLIRADLAPYPGTWTLRIKALVEFIEAREEQG